MSAVVSSTAGKRILVVDDHPDICALMQAALEGAGYEVETAADGAQAVSLARSRPVDLVITDIFMPVQEGFETVARFQTDFPQTGIIVMSAGFAAGMQQDFLRAAALLPIGATLRKPFTADQLIETVRKVL